MLPHMKQLHITYLNQDEAGPETKKKMKKMNCYLDKKGQKIFSKQKNSPLWYLSINKKRSNLMYKANKNSNRKNGGRSCFCC